MGKLNLLKGSYTGKLGQTVGAKWKNLSTIRTYTKPAYTNTPAQMTIRKGFGELTSFAALFADQLKSFSALNTKGMSVRNAIIRLNKETVSLGELDPADLLISRGGLPNVGAFTPAKKAANAGFTATWTPAQGVTITAKSKVIAVFVDPANSFAVVGSALNSAGTMDVPAAVPASGNFHCYYYLLDFRGSSRVASPSSYDDTLA